MFYHIEFAGIESETSSRRYLKQELDPVPIEVIKGSLKEKEGERMLQQNLGVTRLLVAKSIPGKNCEFNYPDRDESLVSNFFFYQISNLLNPCFN